jgi:hypothetical protein
MGVGVWGCGGVGVYGLWGINADVYNNRSSLVGGGIGSKEVGRENRYYVEC